MHPDDDDPNETPEEVIARVTKLAKTDPTAADAALRRFARAREAREANDPFFGRFQPAGKSVDKIFDDLLDLDVSADDAPIDKVEPEKARETEGRSGIEGFGLSDSKVGTGISAAEVEELLGDLEISAEDAPVVGIRPEMAEPAAAKQDDEAKIDAVVPAAPLDVRAEAPRVSMKLREKMRAKVAEINGTVDVAEDDPLAKDKKKVANMLRKVRRTLADLPPDWDKLPQTAKIPGERSRRSEAYRVFSEGEEAMREAERLRELEKRGHPANYDLLPRSERERVDARARKRRSRDKKRMPSSKPTVTPLPLANIAADSLSSTLKTMLRRLDAWAHVSSTPRARQLRKPEHQLAIIKAAAAYSRCCQQNDKPPSHVDLAKTLRCSKDKARRKLDVLKSLYAPGGPWASA